jgi:hypothetical protein
VDCASFSRPWSWQSLAISRSLTIFQVSERGSIGSARGTHCNQIGGDRDSEQQGFHCEPRKYTQWKYLKNYIPLRVVLQEDFATA